MDNGRAELSCKRCGLVIEENIIDKGQDWNAYNREQINKRARTGAPMCLGIADKGLPTDIDFKNKDAKGKNIPERNIRQINRLRRWNKRNRVSRTGERNLAIALTDLDRKSSTLSIPRSVREDAALIYRDVAKKGLVRGRSIETVVAASIYIACRRCEVPRTMDEIAEVANISKKRLGKNYRFISRQLNIKLRPTSPADFIPRYASKLGLSGIVESKAIEIVKASSDIGLTIGKEPTGFAATCLYVASILHNEKKTQRDVSLIAGVTEVTIRNRYKELCENLDFNALNC